MSRRSQTLVAEGCPRTPGCAAPSDQRNVAPPGGLVLAAPSLALRHTPAPPRGRRLAYLSPHGSAQLDPASAGALYQEDIIMKAIRIILAAASAPALAAASVALSTGPAAASPVPSITSSTVHHAGSCTASGQYAICVASGNAWHPRRIRVHVHAAPDQHVSVAWDMVCSKGSGAGSRSGSFTAYTPVNRIIRHPYFHPRSCTIASDAQLMDGGHWIAVWNTYRRW